MQQEDKRIQVEVRVNGETTITLTGDGKYKQLLQFALTNSGVKDVKANDDGSYTIVLVPKQALHATCSPEERAFLLELYRRRPDLKRSLAEFKWEQLLAQVQRKD